MTVIGEVAADSYFGFVRHGEENVSPDTDVGNIFNNGNLGISADIDVRGIQRCRQMDLILSILAEGTAVLLDGSIGSAVITDGNTDPVVKAACHGDVGCSADIKQSFTGCAAAVTVNGTHIDIVLKEHFSAVDGKSTVADSELSAESNFAFFDGKVTAGNDPSGEGHRTIRINRDRTRIVSSGQNARGILAAVNLIQFSITGKILITSGGGVPSVTVADSSIGHFVGETDVASGNNHRGSAGHLNSSGNGVVISA